MYYVILFASYCVVSVAAADLCETVKIKYTIGISTPILDVHAEDISRMSSSCYKEVIIPGARITALYVGEAQFGLNKAYEYSGLVGTNEKAVYDTILVHFGNCSSMIQGLNVTTGLSMEFTSDILCLHIKPEIKYRPLGAHMAGGRIRLNVRINVAVCPTKFYTKDSIGRKCQPLCSRTGMLHNCKRVTTIQSALSSRKSSKTVVTTKLPRTTSTKPRFTTEMKASRYVTQQTSTLDPLKSTKTRTTTSVISPTVPGVSFTTTILSPSPTVITKAVTAGSSSTQIAPISGYTSKSLTSTDLVIQMYTKFAEPHEHTTEHASTKSMVITSTSKTHTTPSSEENSHSDEGHTDFGLMEGLYVIAGCIVILLLLGITAFLIRKRTRYSSSSGSNTTSFPRNGLYWRDNWLVRYHNNEIEGDSFSQPDSEIQYIHSNCLNQSNTDLHYMHHLQYPEIMKYKQNEDPYDNPWHLVMLDSDFVRNTKNLEGEKGNPDASEHARLSQVNETTASEAESCPKKREIVNVNEKVLQSKNHLPKYVGPPMPSRGKYNIAKVERSNSKTSFKTEHTLSKKRAHLKHSNRKRTQSESHLTSVESKKKGHTRQINSSSICSDNCPTFEEMLNDEIHNIEDVLDVNSNIDTESNGSGHTNGSDVRRNWKVSTLYAIVSSRDGTSPQDFLVARNPSHKRQKSNFNRSQSYRKFRQAENMTKQTIRSISRKESMCKERSCSQRKSNNDVDLPEDPSRGPDNETGSVNEEANDKTFTETSSCDRSCLENISPTEHFNELDKIDDLNSESCKSRVFKGDSDQNDGAENVLETRNTFLQNREKFEQNGSITQYNSGASGTGQFPK